jgi:D-inositol-3-phosphate glycosyltransferase
LKKLLWIGDAACPSGFARATHGILDVVRDHYEVTVLGLNYRGDPHEYPYPIYAAAPGGDSFGVGRLIWMCDTVKPDVIVLQNDGWNIPGYMRQLVRFKDYANVPVVAALAVDGKNFQGDWLDGVAYAVFWTQFALREAREGGYAEPATVIPLGVDTYTYHPMDKGEARLRRFKKDLGDVYIVGNVNRNQPRKRWDLTIKYFAEWVRSRKIDNAYLFLHVAPTGDTGCDVRRLAKYYGVLERLALMEPPTWYGIPDDEMRDTYNCFDAQVSTTQGEGFGLTTFEGMVCGVPQIVPAWSALGELTKNAAMHVGCPTTAIGPPYVNVIGGVPDEEQFINHLHALYQSEERRQWYRARGLERVAEPRFRWSNVGEAWVKVLNEVVGVDEPHRVTEEEWKDLGRPEEMVDAS